MQYVHILVRESTNLRQSMGLHSDSPSILSIVSNSAEEKESINSQLRAISRAILAHPPAWGARIACGVLSDPHLRQAW